MKSEKLLRHVVLFAFKEDTPPQKIVEIESAFAQLPNKIKQIHSFEWGINNSPEGLNKGLTHCFFVTFTSEKDRDLYLPHPDHMAFVSMIKDYIEDVVVIDYWVKS